MDQYRISDNSRLWDFFVKVAFAVAIISTLLGIYMLPGPMLFKGYFLMSALLIVFLTITLSKAMRSRHESPRLHNKVGETRTSKLIQELQGK